MYQNSLDNPFVFDDRETVLLNRSLIAAWDWRAVLFHNVARPVVNLSFALDRALWGFSSFGYHITNVVLHITAVGLFYGWCTRALTDGTQTAVRRGSGRRQTRVGPRSGPSLAPAPEWAAFFAAAVFALHPVMSAAVGYVSGRSELLAAIGFLASLTYARRAILAASRPAGTLAMAFGVLAVASSSSAAALPLLVLAYDAWVLRHPGWPLRAARIYAPAALAVVIAAGWYLTGIEMPAVPPRGPVANLLTGGLVVWRYLGLLLFPRGLALVHEVQWVTTPWHPVAIALLAVLAGGVTLAVMWRRTQPLLAFGVAWFVGVLAPTTSFFPVRDAMAEHRLYLAAAGLLLAAASIAAQPLAARRTVRAALAVLLLVLAAGTYRRNRAWADPVQLWEESVRRSPGAWQAHWGYGELLREIGQCDRAVSEYEAVLRLHPLHRGAVAGLEICR